MIYWPAKAPGAVADYEFDFSPALDADETIASKQLTCSGVTKDGEAIVAVGDTPDAGVQVWLSGGTPGTVASVACTVTTSEGRTYPALAVLEIGGEPVSLASAKDWLKVTSDAEDALIGGLVAAAVRTIEAQTGKRLTARIVSQVLDRFPNGGRSIRLNAGPVSEILSATYDDASGIEQTLDSFRLIEGSQGQLLPAYGECFPATAWGAGAVRLRYVAGYDPTELPRDLVQAALMLVAHWYVNRDAVSVGRPPPVELPLGVSMLIDPYRPVGLA